MPGGEVVGRLSGFREAQLGSIINVGSRTGMVLALERSSVVVGWLGEDVDPVFTRRLERRAPRFEETIEETIVETGISWIDLFDPLRRGEHRRVSGHGKTTMLVTAALRSPCCVFVTFSEPLPRLRSQSSIRIVAAATPMQRVLAPRAGCALAEELAQTRDVLLVIDDMHLHDAAIDELSAALGWPFAARWALCGRIGGRLTMLSAGGRGADAELTMNRGDWPILEPHFTKLGPRALPKEMRRLAGVARMVVSGRRDERAERVVGSLRQGPEASRSLAESYALLEAAMR